MTNNSNKQTVHFCDDCGCEVDFDTGYCAACDSFPSITTSLVDSDERRPESHTETMPVMVG
jgi:predicted ATP-dependent serine protease